MQSFHLIRPNESPTRTTRHNQQAARYNHQTGTIQSHKTHMHEALLWNTILKLLCFFGGSGRNPSHAAQPNTSWLIPKYRKLLARQELPMQSHFGTERKMKLARAQSHPAANPADNSSNGPVSLCAFN
jgi:hypothetical protein